MSRPFAVVAALLVLSACGKSEPSADSTMPAAAMPAPLTNADLMGTWEATGMPMDRDTVVVRFTMTNSADSSIVVFESGERIQNVPGMIAGDSVVSTAGPFPSQLRKGQQVTTRMVMRMEGDKLVGVSQSKYSNGDSASFRITATKKP